MICCTPPPHPPPPWNQVRLVEGFSQPPTYFAPPSWPASRSTTAAFSTSAAAAAARAKRAAAAASGPDDLVHSADLGAEWAGLVAVAVEAQVSWLAEVS